MKSHFPQYSDAEIEEFLLDSGGGFAFPEQGFGAVDKKLNIMGKQMRGTTNNAKVHEDSHLMGIPTEEISWSNIEIHPGEAAARGTQIKSVLGIKDSTPITGEQLKYMKDNFVRLTNIDNNMQAFLDSITDFDSAADWLSRNAYSKGGALNLLKYDFLKHSIGGKGF